MSLERLGGRPRVIPAVVRDSPVGILGSGVPSPRVVDEGISLRLRSVALLGRVPPSVNRSGFSAWRPRCPSTPRASRTPAGKSAESAESAGRPVPRRGRPGPPRSARGWSRVLAESRCRSTAWEDYWINDEQRRQWISAGLGPDDGRIAGRLRDRGFAPGDLLLWVDGPRQRATARWRAGQPRDRPAPGAEAGRERRRRVGMVQDLRTVVGGTAVAPS